MSPAPHPGRTRGRIAAALIAVAVPLVGSCAGPPAAPTPPETSECLVAGPGEPSPPEDTIVVALQETVQPDHAPVPQNGAERLVFAQLYRTLVRVDCQGRVQPDLAVGWESDAEGRSWRFELDPAASSPEGQEITAPQVASMLAARVAPAVAGGLDVGGSVPEGPGPVAPAGDRAEWAIPPGIIDSLQATGEFAVVVHLASPRTSPKLLADPAFAISGPGDVGGGGWPPATGRSTVLGGALEGVRPGSLILSRGTGSDAGGLVFWPAADVDPRDLLEAGADMLLTADLEVVDYARTRARFTSEALPWERAYVLAATSRVRELRAGAPLAPPSLDVGLLESLARDAVRATARGHAGAGWWRRSQLKGCGSAPEGGRQRPPPVPSGAYGTRGPRRLVYDASDPIARDLAERLVALSGSDAAPARASLAGIVPDLSDGEELVAVGRDETAFRSSLSRGEEFGYLLALPLRVYDACLELERLRRRAEWLSAWELDPADVVVPLVDVRPHVIFRRGVPSAEVAWDGTLLLPGTS